MLRTVIVSGALVMLAACGDPLSDVDRVSELDLPPKDAAAAALPTAEETAREGFLGTKAAEPTQAAKAAAETIANADAGDTAVSDPVVAVAEPAPERKGILGGLFTRATNKSDDAATDATEVAKVASEATAADATQAAAGADASTISEAVAASQAATIEEPIIAKTTPDTSKTGATRTAALASKPEAVVPPVPAALAPAPAAEPAAKPARRGLFNGNRRNKVRTGPDALEVGYGETVSYGVIARSCASRGRPLGRKTEKPLARGYAVYDSAPGTGGMRTWYITGFDDGCPRQLTAASVQVGPASFYEQLRYSSAGRTLRLGATDTAYEVVKRKVCRVSPGKPCGDKIGKMDKTTFFVTAYQRFGNSSTWVEVLVHDGEVRAIATKP